MVSKLFRKYKFLTLFIFIALHLANCSHNPNYTSSSRDILPREEEFILQKNQRVPANWGNDCFAYVRNIFSPKTEEVVNSLPELNQLNPVIKKFPNGKKYTEYTANPSVMKNDPVYEDFLEQTAEVIFEPVDPFGHINLRVGKKIYSFNFINSTSVNEFSPRMKKSNIAELPSSSGYVFALDKQKILEVEDAIKAFYKSSSSHNIPPFDAYSPMLKIIKSDDGKKLQYKTDSPKYGNNSSLNGEIVEENGHYLLDAGNGVKMPVTKKGDDYYTQSYSCSSSAAYIMEKYFGVKISYGVSAKSIQQSLAQGNVSQSVSPIGVIKYYEE